MEYGHACNGQLRAVACAYQELVLGTDCNTGQPLPKAAQARLQALTV